jgi:hypothetical protein
MANSVILVGLLGLLASCAGRPQPYAESHPLDATDIDVLRVALLSTMQPLTEADPKRVIALATSTLTIPFWHAPPPSFPPSPPPPFRGSHDLVVPPPPPAALDATLFSPEERAAWELRNRVAQEMPDLGIAGWVRRQNWNRMAAKQAFVAASAPSYPTKDKAMLYASFVCGETCGEGRLIRLTRHGSSWRVTASQMLWIS